MKRYLLPREICLLHPALHPSISNAKGRKSVVLDKQEIGPILRHVGLTIVHAAQVLGRLYQMKCFRPSKPLLDFDDKKLLVRNPRQNLP